MATRLFIRTKSIPFSTSAQTDLIQRKCTQCDEREKSLQRRAVNQSKVTDVPPIVHEVLNSPGQPLDADTRTFMESRFGHELSQVRVHTNAKATESARVVNALAYTVGHNVVFGENQFSPHTTSGKTLLTHELVHVLQQRGLDGKLTGIDPDPSLEREAQVLSENRNDVSIAPQTATAKTNCLQRQSRGGVTRGTSPNQRLEFRPSAIMRPCACLVFIHNDERNARSAAEELHRNCHYNLAIIGAGQTRQVTVRGSSGRIDPNELFPSNIQEECTRNEAGCMAYEASHNDLRAMQIQFFLTIKRCSNDFTLQTVALHNNALNDTSSFLRRTLQSNRQQLRGNFSREFIDPITSRSELRRRLGSHRGIMARSGTSNIFRWCNLPEISRCHIGDPDHPDHLIWVTTIQNYNILSGEDVNVVLQEGLNTTRGSESESDLSTLFLRLGQNVHYINIETPISPRTQAVRSSNMQFIQNILGNLNLDCCEPIGDFPTPSSTERLA